MGEVQRIVDQLARAYEGEAWHGPALTALLSGVKADQAAARPVAGGHSIWELVLHIAAWEDVVRRRALGEAVAELPDSADWPVADGDEKAWQDALRRLDHGHRRLRETLAGLDESRLGERVAGQDYTVYVMLHGVVQHDLYHAGQIALLKKAAVR